MADIKGKSLKLLMQDIAEGYITVNFLFLKSFSAEDLKAMHKETGKALAAIRSEKFPHNENESIRHRNTRLQRLHAAEMIIRNYARDKKIQLI